MKTQTPCMRCGKVFWSLATKNPIDRRLIPLENICHGCKNKLKQNENRKVQIKKVPEGVEKYIRLRELQQAEIARRVEERNREEMEKEKKCTK